MHLGALFRSVSFHFVYRSWRSGVGSNVSANVTGFKTNSRIRLA
ncbi:hypothetical protein [Paenibacillus catalpae]|nr:hypothetical protein [Paenibacillus catalpae]